jgi:hypothetical protein
MLLESKSSRSRAGQLISGFDAALHEAVSLKSGWMFDNFGKRVVSVSGTQDLMNTYPAPVRNWIARHGGLTPRMIYLRGRDLAAIVAPCDGSRTASVPRAKRFSGLHQIDAANTPRASFGAR